ncbi:MAG: hypothetical protein ABWW69_07615 [Pyrodictiaceae archaeon]
MSLKALVENIIKAATEKAGEPIYLPRRDYAVYLDYNGRLSFYKTLAEGNTKLEVYRTDYRYGYLRLIDDAKCIIEGILTYGQYGIEFKPMKIQGDCGHERG